MCIQYIYKRFIDQKGKYKSLNFKKIFVNMPLKLFIIYVEEGKTPLT